MVLAIINLKLELEELLSIVPKPRDEYFYKMDLEFVDWESAKTRNFFTILVQLLNYGPQSIKEISESLSKHYPPETKTAHAVTYRIIYGGYNDSDYSLINYKLIHKKGMKISLSATGILFLLQIFARSSNDESISKNDKEFNDTLLELIKTNYPDKFGNIFQHLEFFQKNKILTTDKIMKSLLFPNSIINELSEFGLSMPLLPEGDDYREVDLWLSHTVNNFVCYYLMFTLLKDSPNKPIKIPEHLESLFGYIKKEMQDILKDKVKKSNMIFTVTTKSIKSSFKIK